MLTVKNDKLNISNVFNLTFNDSQNLNVVHHNEHEQENSNLLRLTAEKPPPSRWLIMWSVANVKEVSPLGCSQLPQENWPPLNRRTEDQLEEAN